MNDKSIARRWKLAGMGALALLGFSMGGMATADSAADDAIEGCVHTTGYVRILDEVNPRPCDPRAEHPISWAKQGPPGPPGAPASAIWGIIEQHTFDPFDPYVYAGEHVTGVRRTERGDFIVSFDRNVGLCAHQVTPRTAIPGTTVLARPPLDGGQPNEIEVSAFLNGMRTEPGFHLTVTCATG